MNHSKVLFERLTFHVQGDTPSSSPVRYRILPARRSGIVLSTGSPWVSAKSSSASCTSSRESDTGLSAWFPIWHSCAASDSRRDGWMRRTAHPAPKPEQRRALMMPAFRRFISCSTVIRRRLVIDLGASPLVAKNWGALRQHARFQHLCKQEPRRNFPCGVGGHAEADASLKERGHLARMGQ